MLEILTEQELLETVCQAIARSEGKLQSSAKVSAYRNLCEQIIARLLYAVIHQMADDDVIARLTLNACLRESKISTEPNSRGFLAGVRFMLRAQVDLQRANIPCDDAGWRRWTGPNHIISLDTPESDVEAEPAFFGGGAQPHSPSVREFATADATPSKAVKDERLRFGNAAREALAEIARTDQQKPKSEYHISYSEE